MTSYNDPKVFLMPVTVGLDEKIRIIQNKLATLSWLEKIFGRATLQRTTQKIDGSSKEREIVFPETWGENREPQNVMPNDNLVSHSFFLLRDPSSFLNYVPLDNQIMIRHPVSLIVWANLEKIDETKVYRFSEELKLDLIKLLNSVPSIEFVNYYEQYDRVFEGCTITPNYRTYLKPPYWACRFDAFITIAAFDENCSTNYDQGTHFISENNYNFISEQSNQFILES